MSTSRLGPARLEYWMRHFYFETDIDIGSSGVQPFSFVELRDLLEIRSDDLDAIEFHDSQTLGGDALRDAVAHRWGRGVRSDVMVTHGSSEALYLVMHAILRAGDEVVVPFPCYQQFWSIARSLGCRITRWPLNRAAAFAPDLDRLEDLLRGEPRLLVMNFPHNPTGATLNPEQRASVLQMAAASGCYVVWDNVFADLDLDGGRAANDALEYDRSVGIGSLSKAYGLPGLRIGWAITNSPLWQRCARLRDYVTLHLSPLVEFVARRAIEHTDRLLASRIPQIEMNRRLVARWAAGSDGAVELSVPPVGVCSFPRLRGVERVFALCRELARTRRVLLVPGTCFHMAGHVRLGFGGRTADVTAGLDLLSELMARYRLAMAGDLNRTTEAPVIPQELSSAAAVVSAPAIPRYKLLKHDVATIGRVVSQTAAEFSCAEDPELLDLARVLSHEFPAPLRRWLNDFRLGDSGPGVCIVSGYPIDDEKIGRTPAHWKDREERSKTLEEEVYHILLASLLGDVFAWSTQQAGHVIHDVLPIKGHETEQLGSSSQALLTWHTEDAFHPYKADYLSLFCLRNPDRVATTIGSMQGISLDKEELELLFQARFRILPDESHMEKNRGGADAPRETDEEALRAAYRRIEEMNTAPEMVSVLFGHPRAPYVRIDPYFMPPLPAGAPAEAALAKLVSQIDAHLSEMVLTPGDCCFLDNYRVVHGRRPFVARYDGRDRWLKRLNITADLRKSRASRAAARSRTIC